MIDVEDRGALFSLLLHHVGAERLHIDVRKRKHRIDVVAKVLDVRRIGTDAKHEHFFSIGDWCNGLDHAAKRGDEHWYFVDAYKLIDNSDADIRLGLVIGNNCLKLAAVYAAFCIDIFNGPSNRLHLVESENSGGTGQRIRNAELQRFLRRNAASCQNL